MMRRGVVLTAIYPEAMYDKDKLVAAIKKTAETGFYNGVEFYFEGSDEDCLEIKELLADLDLYGVFLAGFPMKSGKIDVSAREESVRTAGVAFVKELLHRASLLGCEKMLILSGPVWEEENRELLVKQFVTSVRELTSEHAEANCMPEISLEFFNTTGEPFLALGEFETIQALCEQLSDVPFGITYDFSHAAQLGMDIPSTLAALLPWVHHIHIANSVSGALASDSPLFGDKHPLFGVPKEDLSIEDVGTMLEDFRKADFYKDVSICSMEMISREDHTQDWYFEQTLHQAQYLWKRD